MAAPIRRSCLRTACAVVVLVEACALGVEADDPIQLFVPGRFYTEPADVRLTITIEPHPDNHVLRIELDGEAMFRASEMRLDGEREKRLHRWEIKSVPAGEYRVTAALFGERAIRGRADGSIVVATGGRR